jgi:hypothetical protein
MPTLGIITTATYTFDIFSTVTSKSVRVAPDSALLPER